jgi:hypothetical protein
MPPWVPRLDLSWYPRVCLSIRAMIKVRELPAPVTASKADWLSSSTWMGFTPSNATLQARNRCQGTIRNQFGVGYVLEYINQVFGNPNPGFDNSSKLAKRAGLLQFID